MQEQCFSLWIYVHILFLLVLPSGVFKFSVSAAIYWIVLIVKLHGVALEADTSVRWNMDPHRKCTRESIFYYRI